MTICPIALAASCKQCPLFKVCPLKGILGDHKEETEGREKETEEEENKQ